MKVCILTWYFFDNYGGILQCWALKAALEEMGVTVDVLNYTPSFLSKKKPWWRGWKLRGGFVENFPRRLKQVILKKPLEMLGVPLGRKFDVFRERHLSLTAPCYSASDVQNLAKNYDAIIVGSDQVWRFPEEKSYFFDFGDAYAGKKISYAACCGSPDIERYQSVSELINAIDFISVRNQFSQETISKVSGREDVFVVEDPTWLVDLDRIKAPVTGLPKEYIVTYIMGKPIEGGHRIVLDEIKKQVGNLPVISIVSTVQCPQFFSFADKRLYSTGPQEWISLLSNASFIYTDSYHATLYALFHNKTVLAYYAEESRKYRFLDLINRYDVSHIIATSSSDAVEKICSTEFRGIREKIGDKMLANVDRSRRFLRESLFNLEEI
jgi:hypothetical protein